MNGWIEFAEENEALRCLLEESALKGSQRGSRYPDHRFFGILCSYFPEELIMAFGLEPLRLLPESANRTLAELPPFSCSLVRGIFDMELKNKWGDLAGIGIVHTCDTMQCLSGIWELAGKVPTVNIVPPVMLRAAGAARYYEKEIRAAWSQLVALTNQNPLEEKLKQAVSLCQKVREMVQAVDELRPQLPSPLVAALLRAGQLMPKAEYLKTLGEVLPGLNRIAADPGSRAKIMITGAVLEMDSLYAMLEELGGRVVADDTCTGFRHYSGPRWVESENLLADIVKRYEEMPPCPCKHQSLNERMSYLLELAVQRQAEGAIILIRKYCEPHAWDAVPLVETLQKAGIRTLVLELEGADVGGQERTRLQAFLESIQENRASVSEGSDEK